MFEMKADAFYLTSLSVVLYKVRNRYAIPKTDEFIHKQRKLFPKIICDFVFVFIILAGNPEIGCFFEFKLLILGNLGYDILA